MNSREIILLHTDDTIGPIIKKIMANWSRVSLPVGYRITRFQ